MIVDELFILCLFRVDNDLKSECLEKTKEKFDFGMFFAFIKKGVQNGRLCSL